jgi:PIN domain nuclease of toxin-antitoxin system
MIFLDTHVLIWMASDPKPLSQKAREVIREAREKLAWASPQ